MGERVSQGALEPVIVAEPNERVSQIAAEVIQDAQGNLRLSQASLEVIQNAFPGARITDLMFEVVGYFIEVPLPLIYPELPGLTFPVDWDTEFFNLPTQKAVNGAEIDIGLADTPLHNFGLRYEVARNMWGFNEERLLRGFFGANRGNLIRFGLKNTDDYRVKSQRIATTDGTTRIYTLIRTYGVGENSWDEPIGLINKTQPFSLYLDGIKQSQSTYTVDTTIGAEQQIIFVGTPTAGQVITVDMEYFYYCKFQDSKMSLQKFMTSLWSSDVIILRSCRPRA